MTEATQPTATSTGQEVTPIPPRGAANLRGERRAENSVEQFRAALTSNEALRVAATARILSTFNGFLVGVCNRSPDQITPDDVRALATIMGAFEGLEVERKGLSRNGHSA